MWIHRHFLPNPTKSMAARGNQWYLRTNRDGTFFKNFGAHISFWGPLIPPFWTSSDIAFGFQSQSWQLYLHLAKAYMMYIPEIHLWCNTCQALDGQHGSQSLSLHACFSRGRMLDLIGRPSA